MDDRSKMAAGQLLSAMIAWRAAWQSSMGRQPTADEVLIWATMITRGLSEDAAVQWLADELEERRAAMAD